MRRGPLPKRWLFSLRALIFIHCLNSSYVLWVFPFIGIVFSVFPNLSFFVKITLNWEGGGSTKNEIFLQIFAIFPRNFANY